MTESVSIASTSLQRLHDIIEPEAISLWAPSAPGWRILLAITAGYLIFLLAKKAKQFHRNAYRSQAIKLLNQAETADEVSVLLKRCALAAFPREDVAELCGEDWVRWLRATSDTPLDDDVANLLSREIYQSHSESNLSNLLSYADRWVRTHRTSWDEQC